jgi:hypothetical protein
VIISSQKCLISHQVASTTSTGNMTDRCNDHVFFVAIMNPPFTHSERLPEEYKDLLLDRFSDCKELIFGKVGFIFFIFFRISG